MEWVLLAIGAYLLLGNGALSTARPVVTPGTQFNIFDGFGITLPGGQTYHLPNGDYVTPMPGNAGPVGWVYGILASTGQAVWLNSATGRIQAAGSGF